MSDYIKPGSLVRIHDHIAEARGGSFPHQYHGKLAYVIRTPKPELMGREDITSPDCYKLRVIADGSGHMPTVYFGGADLHLM